MRFRVRNLLGGTAWTAVWLAVCINYERLPYLLEDERYGIPVFLPLWVLLVGGPFIAAGSFVGRTMRGFLVGFYVAALLVIFAGVL